MALENCPLCRGTGWKLVPPNHRNSGQELVTLDKPGFAQGTPKFAVACDCTIEDRATRAMERARIPKRYEHCDFESYVTDLADGKKCTPQQAESLKRMKMTTQGFVREYPEGDRSGLLLMGNSGVGKTHLAVAALKELLRRGHQGLFCDYREFLKEIQASYNPASESTEMRILEPIRNAEILVLDDLGASKPSAWVLDIIGLVLNARYSERRVTILTTNYLDEKPATEPAPRLPSGASVKVVKEDSLADRIGARMRSRLYEMCRTVEVFAPDFRREIRQSTRARA